VQRGPSKAVTGLRADAERGQAAVEWAGVLVVVALIILASTAASPSLASAVARSVRCSVITILGSSACQGAGPGNGPTREQLGGEARAIVDEHYNDFVRHPHPAPFDWSTDGCSVPMFARAAAFVSSPSLGFGLQHAMDVFRPACELHDFRYRNFGKGLHLDQNENTRAWIDHRFWREMARICDDYYEAWYDKLDGEWESCEAWAKAFYAAVWDGGRSAYY
jgi:hypothetical protein